jgi:hypothetical protein
VLESAIHLYRPPSAPSAASRPCPFSFGSAPPAPLRSASLDTLIDVISNQLLDRNYLPEEISQAN